MIDGPAAPTQAPYRGGITSNTTDGHDCTRAWTTPDARTATLPKITTGDRLVQGLPYGPPPALPTQSTDLRTPLTSAVGPRRR